MKEEKERKKVQPNNNKTYSYTFAKARKDWTKQNSQKSIDLQHKKVQSDHEGLITIKKINGKFPNIYYKVIRLIII